MLCAKDSRLLRFAASSGCGIAGSFAAHAVGCGIKPSSLVEDRALKHQIQRLWLAWTDEADADGLTDFYGLQTMAARAMFEAGECFFRFRARRPEDGLAVPLQLQMLSSEHLPLAKCETLPNGNEIIFGIELDRIGRRVAYHFHRTHPGDVRQRSTRLTALARPCTPASDGRTLRRHDAVARTHTTSASVVTFTWKAESVEARLCHVCHTSFLRWPTGVAPPAARPLPLARGIPVTRRARPATAERCAA